MPTVVEEYFKNKTVLLTGSTGFMGTVFALQLLQLPIAKLVLLVRNPSLPSSIINSPRVSIITGFSLEKGLGLSHDTINLLVDNVDLVYHSAAIIKWNVPFKTHLNLNTIAVTELYNIFKPSKRLELFVFLSSTGLDATRPNYTIDKLPETVLDLPGKSAPELLQEWLDIDTNKLLPHITDRSNMGYLFYVLSKRLAEQLLHHEFQQRPRFNVLVARFASIDAAMAFPAVGYAHKYEGAGVAQIKAGIEGYRYLPPNVPPQNSTPVDMCGNMLLVNSAYDRVLSSGFRVINAASNTRNDVGIDVRYEASSHVVGPVIRLPLKEAKDKLEKIAKTDKKARINLVALQWHLPKKAALMSDDEARRVIALMSKEEKQKWSVDINDVDWVGIMRAAVDRYVAEHQISKL
ncbi:cyclin-dependent kinase inhibitor far1 [Boothiomyces macroporosus]|uniref:Fatty acyl-CoA reductase n=1 Tax=Boothiomyces macroporosus TaxID=261099 RepID=A0AAD5UB34_9FUNG|nr:cyclin-dependent kinase inhibitor far1 [Boothiomyces macroporosus]